MSVPLMMRTDTYEPGVAASSVCPCPPPTGADLGSHPGAPEMAAGNIEQLQDPFLSLRTGTDSGLLGEA